jgi:tripartite-type tricarboxylate transporter receptor subunit TctC
MPYDTEKDFTPISLIGRVPMLLVVHPTLPVNDFPGFIDYARKNPGKINVANAGNGTLPHVTMEYLMVKEHMQVTNVPYRGASPALADLVAGQVQAKIDAYTTSAQFIADKRLKPIAVTSTRRLRQLPEVATMAETVPGIEGYLWIGIVAPSGTPPAVLDKLAAVTNRAVARPEVQARFDKDGIEPVGGGAAEFKAQIAREIAQWRELAKQADIRID